MKFRVYWSDGNDRMEVDRLDKENIDEAIEAAFRVNVKPEFHNLFENVEQGDPEFGVVYQLDICHKVGNPYCDEDCENCEYPQFEFLEVIPEREEE